MNRVDCARKLAYLSNSILYYVLKFWDGGLNAIQCRLKYDLKTTSTFRTTSIRKWLAKIEDKHPNNNELNRLIQNCKGVLSSLKGYKCELTNSNECSRTSYINQVRHVASLLDQISTILYQNKGFFWDTDKSFEHVITNREATRTAKLEATKQAKQAKEAARTARLEATKQAKQAAVKARLEARNQAKEAARKEREKQELRKVPANLRLAQQDVIIDEFRRICTEQNVDEMNDTHEREDYQTGALQFKLLIISREIVSCKEAISTATKQLGIVQATGVGIESERSLFNNLIERFERIVKKQQENLDWYLNEKKALESLFEKICQNECASKASSFSAEKKSAMFEQEIDTLKCTISRLRISHAVLSKKNKLKIQKLEKKIQIYQTMMQPSQPQPLPKETDSDWLTHLNAERAALASAQNSVTTANTTLSKLHRYTDKDLTHKELLDVMTDMTKISPKIQDAMTEHQTAHNAVNQYCAVAPSRGEGNPYSSVHNFRIMTLSPLEYSFNQLKTKIYTRYLSNMESKITATKNLDEFEGIKKELNAIIDRIDDGPFKIEFEKLKQRCEQEIKMAQSTIWGINWSGLTDEMVKGLEFIKPLWGLSTPTSEDASKPDHYG